MQERDVDVYGMVVQILELRCHPGTNGRAAAQ